MYVNNVIERKQKEILNESRGQIPQFHESTTIAVGAYPTTVVLLPHTALFIQFEHSCDAATRLPACCNYID